MTLRTSVMDEAIQQALLDANMSVECKRWLQDDEAHPEQKLAAVRRLHQQYRTAWSERDVCAHCTTGMNFVFWPCPTMQIIDG
jgi:hypothetical protein